MKQFHFFDRLLCVLSEKSDGFMTSQLFFEKAQKNRENFLKKLNIDLNNVFFPIQTHSTKIKIISQKDLYGKKRLFNCDGFITKEEGVFLTIFVSDCVPIFLFDPQKRISGLLHAGWRGTLFEIAKKGVSLFKKLGSKNDNIFAFIGPSIGLCCYHIPVERKKIFQRKFSFVSSFIKEKRGQFFLDLKGLNREILKKAGLKNSHIFKSPDCTFCQENFFSWRRKEDYQGNMMAVIGFKK